MRHSTQPFLCLFCFCVVLSVCLCLSLSVSVCWLELKCIMKPTFVESELGIQYLSLRGSLMNLARPPNKNGCCCFCCSNAASAALMLPLLAPTLRTLTHLTELVLVLDAAAAGAAAAAAAARAGAAAGVGGGVARRARVATRRDAPYPPKQSIHEYYVFEIDFRNQYVSVQSCVGKLVGNLTHLGNCLT